MVYRKIPSLSYIRLLAVTAEIATVCSKIKLKLSTKRLNVEHAFIVVDIIDEVIIDADIMISHGILYLHMKQYVMSS